MLFTIGHSTHAFPHFANLLKMNGITAIADVRAKPEAGPWSYGTASLDLETGKISAFQPFHFFTGKSWQNASAGGSVRRSNWDERRLG